MPEVRVLNVTTHPAQMPVVSHPVGVRHVFFQKLAWHLRYFTLKAAHYAA